MKKYPGFYYAVENINTTNINKEKKQKKIKNTTNTNINKEKKQNVGGSKIKTNTRRKLKIKNK